MKLTLQAWDDDAALRLPKTLMKQLGVTVGEMLEVSVVAGTLRLCKTGRPHYTLAELMAQTDGELPMVEEWEQMPALGREKL